MPRPISDFHGFVGQNANVRRARLLCRNAKNLPHSLLTGASGLGKTTFARSVATERGVALHPVFGGPQCHEEFWTDLVGRIQPHDIVFVDEIHRISPRQQEIMYPYMEQSPAKTVADPRNAAPFTIMGATDQPGALNKALSSRFQETFEFSQYSRREFDHISRSYATELGLLFKPQALRLLQRACRGNPRTIRNMLSSFQSHMGTNSNAEIRTNMVRSFLRLKQIYPNGLHNRDMRLLRYLATMPRNSAALAMLTQILGTDELFFCREIEPWLVRSGWMEVTVTGRKITKTGLELVEATTLSEINRERRKTPIDCDGAHRPEVVGDAQTPVPHEPPSPAGGGDGSGQI